MTGENPAIGTVDAIEIIGETVIDLVTLAESMPVTAGTAEDAAEILDRLSEDLAEAATLIRQAGARSERLRP